MHFRKKIFIALSLAIGLHGMAQTTVTTIADSNWTTHFQLTIIGQQHTAFKSLYSGTNSLADTVEPIATSLTTTLFLGRKLWKGAAVFVNPEVSGGKGLTFAKGVAGALNGETYRVGAVEPKVFLARVYLQQTFALKNSRYVQQQEGNNQLAQLIPESRVTISAGKFSISDFYDDNAYCKDPRTQFFNWSLWANGAWDYPANTRGYTKGLVVELIKPTWAVRLSTVAVPRIANFSLMEYKLRKAHSETLEFEHGYTIKNRPGKLRFILSNTHTRAPSYTDGIKAIQTGNTTLLDVINGTSEGVSYGGKKVAFGLNMEQEVSSDVGLFSRLGWNDGKYASWSFTEIDRTFNVGFNVKGNGWHRKEDVLGVATVFNGISTDHRTFMKNGGYGFLIGDGNLNYGNEHIVEAFYNAKVNSFLWVTIDYQFVNHPGYNKDRGPVNTFAIRGHIAF